MNLQHYSVYKIIEYIFDENDPDQIHLGKVWQDENKGEFCYMNFKDNKVHHAKTKDDAIQKLMQSIEKSQEKVK